MRRALRAGHARGLGRLATVLRRRSVPRAPGDCTAALLLRVPRAGSGDGVRRHGPISRRRARRQLWLSSLTCPHGPVRLRERLCLSLHCLPAGTRGGGSSRRAGSGPGCGRYGNWARVTRTDLLTCCLPGIDGPALRRIQSREHFGVKFGL